MKIRILGSAAGGGFPQWNCTCSNCRRLRAGTLQSAPRTQAQVAVSLDEQRWCLLNASPDLRSQIEARSELHPRPEGAHNSRCSPIHAVVLTSGDLDQTLGLLLLREFQPLEVYATASVRKILTEENVFFRMLQRVSPQAVWNDASPGRAFALGNDSHDNATHFELIPLEGQYPVYVSRSQAAALPASEAVVALEIQSGSSGKKMIYCPALPEISDELLGRIAACDLLLLDGTFWSDDELVRVTGSGRSAREMGHLPISGHGGSLERLRTIMRSARIYIHINNTNPILDETSAEWAQLTAAGWTVAHDGMSFDL